MWENFPEKKKWKLDEHPSEVGYFLQLTITYITEPEHMDK